MDEIEDVYEVVFDLDNDGDFVDEDGDGNLDGQVLILVCLGFSLGSFFVVFFDCLVLLGWFCWMKIGYLVLIIVIIVLVVVIVRKVQVYGILYRWKMVQGIRV